MKTNKETVGEDLIADFLEEAGYKFKREYKLPNLNYDELRFRSADFYLPEYKVCIEFLGMWYDPKHRSRYKYKMKIYHENKIPCIYLWPDNLGTLNWMIERRLREVLLKYNKWSRLILFETQTYLGNTALIIFLAIVFIYLAKIDLHWKIILGVILVGGVYKTISKTINRLRRIKKSKWVSRDG